MTTSGIISIIYNYILYITFFIILTAVSLHSVWSRAQRYYGTRRKRLTCLILYIIIYFKLNVVLFLLAFWLHLLDRWYVSEIPLLCLISADLITFSLIRTTLDDVIGDGFLYNFVEKVDPNVMMSETFDKLGASGLQPFENTITYETFIRILDILAYRDSDIMQIMESTNTLVGLFDINTMYITTNGTALTRVEVSITNELKDVDLSSKQEFVNAAINFVYHNLFVKYHLMTESFKPSKVTDYNI